MAGFHQSFSVDVWIGVLIFGFLSCFALMAALSFVIYSFYCTDRMKKISLSIKLCSVMSLAFFFGAQLFNHLYMICIKLPNGSITKFTEDFWGIYNSFWAFGYFFTYLLFYERLRQTFNKTPEVALTALQSIIFFTLLSCFIISQQLISIIWLIFVLDKIDWLTFNGIYGPLLWAKFSIDFILNIYVIFLFCSKIFKITLEKHRRESRSSVQRTNTNSFKNDHSFKIFDVMIKYFLLTFITVLSTQIFTASQITLSVSIAHAVKTDRFQFYYTTYIWHFLLGCSDSVVSSVYIVLTFPITKGWYEKICNVLHAKCVQIWAKCALAAEPLEIDVDTPHSFAEHMESIRSKSTNTDVDDASL
eukprot:309640_1